MQWHDILGAALMDFFDGTPYSVETEIHLSLKRKWLDLVVIRKNAGELDRTLPDGLAPLVKYNLISFKSHQDVFDSWALLELIGHYVDYRKKISPSKDALLPEEDFRLYGVAARFPEKLAKETPLEEREPGVYDIVCGPICVRLLVIRNLENRPANAVLELFSVVPEQIEYACQNYPRVSERLSQIVENLIRKYQKEDVKMATTADEIYHKILREAPVKDRLEGLTPKDILRVMPHEDILKELSPEEIENFMRKTRKTKPTRRKGRGAQK